MPHLLVVDIDDSTLAAIEELVHSRALIATLAQCKLDDQKVQHLAPNGAAPNPIPSVALAAVGIADPNLCLLAPRPSQA